MDQAEVPVFLHDYQSLVKPKGIGGVDWLRALEGERNKADCLGNLEAFKGFTKEISATIAGKYGLSLRQATAEEQAELIYSITRTRHKFSGANDILPRFYGVSNIESLPTHHQAHLAAALTIDTLAAEAIGNDDLLNKWSEIRSDRPINLSFIESVKAHAKTWTKEPLFTTLEPSMDSFLQNSKTIAFAHDVFSIFAPKISLKTIYSEMFNGEYRGWTVHGYSTFSYPISLSEGDNTDYPGLETALRLAFTNALAGKSFRCAFFPRSSVAGFASDDEITKLSLSSETVILEYTHNHCLDVSSDGLLKGQDTRRLFLTRAINPALTEILTRYNYKISEENLLSIYRYCSQLSRIIAFQKPVKELEFLTNRGIFFGLCAQFFFEGKNGLTMNKLKAIEICKEGADLGDAEAKFLLPCFVANYASCLAIGDGIERDISKAVDFCRESIDLGYERSKKPLPAFLFDYAFCLLKGKSGVNMDIPKAIEIWKEALALGSKEASDNMLIFLKAKKSLSPSHEPIV